MKSNEKSQEYQLGLQEQPEIEVVPMEMGGSKQIPDDDCECPSDFLAAPIIGKEGAKYTKHGAFCLETQNYPDAVNHPNFPSPILEPGEVYFNRTILSFGVTRPPPKCNQN